MYRANFHHQPPHSRTARFFEPYTPVSVYRSTTSLPVISYTNDSFRKKPANGLEKGIRAKFDDLDQKEIALRKKLTNDTDITEAQRMEAAQNLSLLENAKKMLANLIQQAQKIAGTIAANIR